MNKNLVIVVIVLLLGVGGWLGYTKMNKGSVAPQTNTPQPSAQTPQTQSLNALMKLGSAQKCTFSYVDNRSSGTMYVAGDGQVRTDMQIETGDVTMGTHTLLTDKTMYMWTEGQKQGFKTSLEAAEQAAAKQKEENPATPKTSQSNVDINTQVTSKCEPWSVDRSLFVLPKDITFTDLNAMMEKATQLQTAPSGSGTPSMQAGCSVCTTLSGEDKVQCMTAFKCN